MWYAEPNTLIEFIMATHQINMGKVRQNLLYTVYSDHLKSKEKTINDTFDCNYSIKMLTHQNTRIHKKSMIKDHLYNAVNEFVVDLRLGNVGNTHAYVEECIEGAMRETQKKIYNLSATFDNDRFLKDEMIEDAGEMTESYYDHPRSVMNTWRQSIDKEVEKIRLIFMGIMEEIISNSKTMECKEFILFPCYSNFFGERTKKEATMNLEIDEKQMSSADTKKRKKAP